MGAISSLVLAVCSSGITGLYPVADLPPAVELLRGNTGSQLCGILILLALITSAASWVAMFEAGQRAQRLAVVLWVAPLILALPLFSNDMFNYAEEGWSVLQGAHPAIVPAGSIPGPFSHLTGMWAGTTAPYPQLTLALQALAVALGGGDVWAGVLLQRLWPCVGLVLAWRGMGHLAALHGQSRRWAVWFVAANPVVLVHGIGGGHQELLAIGLISQGLAWISRHRDGLRWAAAGALLTVGAGLVKPTSLLIGAVLPAVWAGRWGATHPIRAALRAAAGVAIATLGTLGVSALLPGGLSWLRASAMPGFLTLSLVRFVESTLLDAAARFPLLAGLTAWWQQHVLVISVVGIALVSVLVVAHWRLTSAATIGAVACLALLVWGPASAGWYAIVLVPLLVLSHAGRRWRVLVMLIVSAWALGFLPGSFTNVASYVVTYGGAAVVAIVGWLWLGSASGRPGPRLTRQDGG